MMGNNEKINTCVYVFSSCLMMLTNALSCKAEQLANGSPIWPIFFRAKHSEPDSRKI